MGIVGGIALGLATSLVGWVLVWAWLRPSVALSTLLACRRIDSSSETVQLKLVNRRFRRVIDVSVQAWLYLPEQHADGGDAVVALPVTVPMCASLGARRPRMLRHRAPASYPQRIATLTLAEMDDVRIDTWFGDLAAAVRSGKLGAFHEMLASGLHRSIHVIVMGTDSVSGVRTVCGSADYCERAIVAGPFARGLSMSVIESI
jgi:hypothetical protein